MNTYPLRAAACLFLFTAVPVTAQSEGAGSATAGHAAPPDHAAAYVANYRSKRMTFEDRMRWAAGNAVSPRRFAGNAISSALGTWANSPVEYGPHWDGYAKRVGLRLSTGATGLLTEAAIGALWNENPRYVRARGEPLRARFSNVFKQVILSKNFEGKYVPAYARYVSTASNHFLTNAWRPDSHATVGRAVTRIQLSFVDRIISNTLNEFGPDVARAVRLKGRREK